MRTGVNIFIFAIGILLFNWPLMKLFSLPLPVYLFASWALFIIVNMLYSSSKRSKTRGE